MYYCIWIFGFWIYDIKKLDINNMYGVIDMLEYEENLRIVIIDLFVKWILKKYVYFLNWYVILMYNIIIRWKDVDRFEGLELL